MALGGVNSRAAHVRLIEPAVDDLSALLRVDPQIVRQILKKLLLLERDPSAGNPLLGQLIGWRKLTVGDRHWRIVWRVTTDDTIGQVVEIAEVWAAGVRSDGKVYAEMVDRVKTLPRSPKTKKLTEVIKLLGRAAGEATTTEEPKNEPVPEWLARRLRLTAGLSEEEIVQLLPEEALVRWEAYLSRPQQPLN